MIDDSESVANAIFDVFLLIAILVIRAIAIWIFSGYLCTTFKWWDIDPSARLITWIVLTAATRGKSK